MGNDVTDERRNGAMTPLCVRNLLRLLNGRANGAWHRRSSRPEYLAGALPMEAKEKDEWRYWQADLLLNADVKLKQKRFCINSCNSVVLPDGCSTTHR